MTESSTSRIFIAALHFDVRSLSPPSQGHELGTKGHAPPLKPRFNCFADWQIEFWQEVWFVAAERVLTVAPSVPRCRCKVTIPLTTGTQFSIARCMAEQDSNYFAHASCLSRLLPACTKFEEEPLKIVFGRDDARISRS